MDPRICPGLVTGRPGFLKACGKARRFMLPRMSPSQSSSHADDAEKLKRELRKKLSRVCEGWTPSAFEALVEDVAEIEFRYRDPTGGPRF